MISDPDIWRAANLLIQQYGADAEIFAALRVDEFSEQVDVDGCALWLRIKRAIVELQARPSGPAN